MKYAYHAPPPPYETAEEMNAVSARRIFRRVKEKPEPTTAVVLMFDDDPPAIVVVQNERFRTRPYIRQTIRCLNCQQFNHRQLGCKNHSKCARCGRQHRTGECDIIKGQPLRCANCRGEHSSASPTCPAYTRVKKAWKLSSTEKMSYAKAIGSLPKPSAMQKKELVMKAKPDSARALGGRPDRAVRHGDARGRDDVIEATIVRPTKYQQERNKSTCSIGTQTEPEVVTTVTQTTMDYASQTEPLPEETASQTSTDVEIQTAKVPDYFDADDKLVIG